MPESNESVMIVGQFTCEYNTYLGTSLPLLDIVQSQGLSIHVQKRHPNMVVYLNNISDILSSPDYIGMNPKEPDSIELVKVYSDNILLAIKLDKNNNYYYISSLYDITPAKLNKNLNNGRLKSYK